MHRSKPNVLITGTPGVGKSTLATELAKRTGLRYISVGEVAKQNQMFDGFDEKLGCPILDEDQLLDELEDGMCEGGNVVDYHSCDFFPERWFDAVFVLRTDNTLLYNRLEQRDYAETKIQENVQCEIFQTVLEEARESYKADAVHELVSNTPDDMENNLESILSLLGSWLPKI